MNDEEREEIELEAELAQEDRYLADIVHLAIRIVIVVLAIAAVALVFSIGKDLWPAWLTAHQMRFIGIVLLALIFLLLTSPLMVEVTEHPRELHALGHRDWPGLSEESSRDSSDDDA